MCYLFTLQPFIVKQRSGSVWRPEHVGFSQTPLPFRAFKTESVNILTISLGLKVILTEVIPHKALHEVSRALGVTGFENYKK